MNNKETNNMKRFFVILMMLLPMFAYGQNATMLAMAQAELQKRGLEEVEVRARLLGSGIDVDNIPPSEYINYQQRIIDILDQMQSEKAQAAADSGADATSDSSASLPTKFDMAEGTIVAKNDSTKVEDLFPKTTKDEADAESKLKDKKNVVETSYVEIYGHSMFTNKTMDVFRTTDGAQAPDTYVLGEGDEVHISIFGSSQTEIHQRVRPDGSIQPAGSVKIFLKGMTLAQGRKAIRSVLAHHYSFREDQIAVTITTARTISVSIYGEVEVNGGFTLSALNTAFNALAAAEGPTDIGSVRNIVHTRAGKSSTIDLYKFMMKPDEKAMYDLQNNDILYVPVAQKVVTVEGPVNRPMRYEMLPDETVADLIYYAGGLRYDTNPDFLQIERHQNGEVGFFEFDLNKVVKGTQKVSLCDGDIVRIRNVKKPMEKYVSITGGVYYDGDYDLDSNASLLGLITRAQPTTEARKEFVFVERTHPDKTVEVITVPFPGENGNPDFTLEKLDKITVLELPNYRDLDTLSVAGHVRKPFKREYGLNDKMTVSQAIELAGGLKTSVYPVAYIFRKNLKNPSKMEYICVNLEKDGDTLLQAGDKLNVYDNSTYTNVGEVHVSGAVKNAFGTTFDSSLTVRDLLTMAGGFEVGAAYDMVQVFRLNISKSEEVKFDKIDLTVDKDYNLVSGDFQVQPYDHIVVRRTPNFTMGRAVELNGRVKYPGTYVLTDTRAHLSEIIAMAGGLLDDADPYASLFRTYNNRGVLGLNMKEVMHSRGRISNDPILMEGDIINIVRQENTVSIRETGTRMAQYVPAEFSSTEKLTIYHGKKSAAWYIRHYAGGFQRTADRKSVTVTLPNGQTIATKSFIGIRCYPKVEPGSVITLCISEKKREKVEGKKEKIDWEATLSKCITTITSIVSLSLLIQRL